VRPPIEPDGTIVESAATDATEATGAAPTDEPAPGGLVTGAAAPPAIDLPPRPVTDDTAAITGEVLYVDAGFHIEGMVFH